MPTTTSRRIGRTSGGVCGHQGRSLGKAGYHGLLIILILALTACGLSVNGKHVVGGQQVQVTTPSLDNAIVGHASRYQLEASGGTKPYTWSVVSGDLNGLTLTSSGVLSGRPTSTGPHTFTVQVADQKNSATRTLTSTVVPLTRWLMGYYLAYGVGDLPVDQIDWTAMTHIIMGRVVPKADGSLDTSLDTDVAIGPPLAKKVATAALANGVTPLLMVGGFGTDPQWRDAAKNHMDLLVENLSKTMDSWGYKGLDLDWEPIKDTDEPLVSELVNKLRDKNKKAVLTMAVGWSNQNFPLVSRFYGPISSVLDRLNIMTVSMTNDNLTKDDGWLSWFPSALHGATQKTPSAVDVSVNSYREAGVPTDKLGIEIGFYGQCWRSGITEPRQQITKPSPIVADDSDMSYTMIMSQYYSKDAYHYDTAAEAPYLSSKTGLGPQKCTYLPYEDVTSITAKSLWAKQQGLGSQTVWVINRGHLKGDPNPDQLLHTAMTKFSL